MIAATPDKMIVAPQADKTRRMSRLDAQSLCRGSGDSMYTRKAYATRETPRRGQGWPTGRPRGTGWAPWGVGGVRSTAEAGECPWRGGTTVQDRPNTWRGTWEIGQPINSAKGSRAADGVARQAKA